MKMSDKKNLLFIKKILKETKVLANKDYDKTDVGSSQYYAGQVDAYLHILYLIRKFKLGV